MGEWHCPGCRCELCGLSDFERAPASEAEPIPMGAVEMFEEDVFGPRTMLLCDQCEKEYHVDCLQQHRGIALTALPQGQWFCSQSCQGVHHALQATVARGKVHGAGMAAGYTWQLLKSAQTTVGGEPTGAEKPQTPLAHALAVLQECFNPVIEPYSGRNLIPMMVFNERAPNAADCSGFYTVVLRWQRSVLCAATIRMFGEDAAEMPLIGTRFTHRRQGLCRRMVRVVEELLLEAGVKRLVLPAVASVQHTWGAFGFHVCEPAERLSLCPLSILQFPGTTLMAKQVNAASHTECTGTLPPPPAAVRADRKRAAAAAVPGAGTRSHKRKPDDIGTLTTRGGACAPDTSVVACTTRSSRTVKTSSAVLAAIHQLTGRSPKERACIRSRSRPLARTPASTPASTDASMPEALEALEALEAPEALVVTEVTESTEATEAPLPLPAALEVVVVAAAVAEVATPTSAQLRGAAAKLAEARQRAKLAVVKPIQKGRRVVPAAASTIAREPNGRAQRAGRNSGAIAVRKPPAPTRGKAKAKGKENRLAAAAPVPSHARVAVAAAAATQRAAKSRGAALEGGGGGTARARAAPRVTRPPADHSDVLRSALRSWAGVLPRAQLAPADKAAPAGTRATRGGGAAGAGEAEAAVAAVAVKKSGGGEGRRAADKRTWQSAANNAGGRRRARVAVAQPPRGSEAAAAAAAAVAPAVLPAVSRKTRQCAVEERRPSRAERPRTEWAFKP